MHPGQATPYLLYSCRNEVDGCIFSGPTPSPSTTRERGPSVRIAVARVIAVTRPDAVSRLRSRRSGQLPTCNLPTVEKIWQKSEVKSIDFSPIQGGRHSSHVFLSATNPYYSCPRKDLKKGCCRPCLREVVSI